MPPAPRRSANIGSRKISATIRRKLRCSGRGRRFGPSAASRSAAWRAVKPVCRRPLWPSSIIMRPKIVQPAKEGLPRGGTGLHASSPRRRPGRTGIAPTMRRVLLRSEVGRYLPDLLLVHVLRGFVHDLVGACQRDEGGELPFEIGLMLAGEPRNAVGALRLLAVTAHARRHRLRFDAVAEDRLPGRHIGGGAGRTGDRRLRRIRSEEHTS